MWHDEILKCGRTNSLSGTSSIWSRLKNSLMKLLYFLLSSGFLSTRMSEVCCRLRACCSEFPSSPISFLKGRLEFQLPVTRTVCCSYVKAIVAVLLSNYKPAKNGESILNLSMPLFCCFQPSFPQNVLLQ